MKTFVLDVSKCVGCYNCQIACKDEHVGNEWLPYAKAQPMAGQFWMRINQEERGTLPKLKVAYVPVLCQHCQNAPCIAACTPGAISTRPDGLVEIDPAKCTGCKLCVDACPYQAIFFNTAANIAQKCTGCAHLLDQYGWKVPRCVDACPTDAFQFGEDADLASFVSQSEVLHPEFKTNPRVHYIALPRRFVAGTVYDPVKKEVVIDATVTLTDTAGGTPVSVKTDLFGDFWFKNLKEGGAFSLKIEAPGFPAKTFDAISTAKDVNLGDIALG